MSWPVSDSFTNTNGTDLSAHNALWVEQPQWASNQVVIHNNRAAWSAAGSSSVYYWNEAPANADYEVSADLAVITNNATNNAGVVARCSASQSTFYMARYRRDTGIQLFKNVNSTTSTQIGSTVAGNYDAPATLKLTLRCVGDQITVLANDVAVIGPLTDTSISAAGFPGIWVASPTTAGVHVDNFAAALYGADTTAPVLTSPTGTATGSTTATVGATTDEGNGTLYAFVSTSATPPAAATLKAGTGAAWAGSQAVSSTGAKTLNATGLTASTGYYAHLIHTDAAANDSNIVSSALFTTGAPASPPTITDQPDSATVKRGQTATFTITASGATSYQWERDTGSGYADISGATSASYTTPATTMADNADLYRCKATNADGTTTSSAATLTVQQCVLALNAAGYEFGDGNSPTTMAVLASTELQVAAYPLTEWPPASPVATATATTSAAGRLADLGDDDLIFGATYRVIARNAANGETWAWTMDAT